MALKLMYITNSVDVALIAEANGVDRIFVDMEHIGKSARQGGMDTVQSRHTVEDARNIRRSIRRAELLVRCNPIHEVGEDYGSSADEIDAIVEAGADAIMLPYFKTAAEVRTFVELVGGRARTVLLIETPEAVACVDDILAVEGVDEVFVGLNDLSLGYGMKFMFQLLADGTVERLCLKFREKGLPYGFGGIAALGKGMLPAERIIAEHYRLGSTCAILSRSFCNVANYTDLADIRAVFESGVAEIRAFEAECDGRMGWFWDNRREMCTAIEAIARSKE